MIVRNGGREFAHFALEDVPPDAAPPTLVAPDGGRGECEWWTGSGRSWDRILAELDVTQADVDSGVVRTCRTLVTTPLRVSLEPDGPGVLFPVGTSPAELELADNPEVVIRGDGSITVF